MAVAKARNQYLEETGIYIPICSDGGIAQDFHILMALAMGADFVMMGRYFATTEESAGGKVSNNGRLYKEYWGEGSNRARNWQRYHQSSGNSNQLELQNERLIFEEGVDAYVAYSGSLSAKLDTSIAKIKATMCNLGVLSIAELHAQAELVQVSEMTLVESSTARVEQFENYIRVS
jgi:IMP dehydrogenase